MISRNSRELGGSAIYRPSDPGLVDGLLAARLPGIDRSAAQSVGCLTGDIVLSSLDSNAQQGLPAQS